MSALIEPSGRWTHSDDLVPSLDPLLVIMMTPLLLAHWRRRAQAGSPGSAMRKMALGALIVAAAYLLLATVAFAAGTGRASWLWLVLFFVVFTLGELYILPTGLGLFARLAPIGYGATTVAAWFFVICIGTLSAGVVGTLWSHISHAEFFAILTVISAIAAAMLFALDRRDTTNRGSAGCRNHRVERHPTGARMKIFALASLTFLGISAAVAAPPSGFDARVESLRKQIGVPGMAIAIVENDKVTLAKGFGVKRLGSPERVDADTIFPTGSTGKAFTVAALGILVDQGKIGWDDKVIDHLPGFQMYDPWVTREMTIRDLLVHRSGLGLGAGDLLFVPRTNLSRAESVRRLRYIKPATSFRSAYAYDNILYMVAGQLIEDVTRRNLGEIHRRPRAQAGGHAAFDHGQRRPLRESRPRSTACAHERRPARRGRSIGAQRARQSWAATHRRPAVWRSAPTTWRDG